MRLRWLLVARTEAEMDAVYDDLATAYREAAEQATPAYRDIWTNCWTGTSR
ncbi:hypothetical protein [Streptomyces sp. NPDC014006]|uniref:hypothetical protein n=1 Tax=Streptomyces sp. NPDC014006 TaxID=3364870 RepID=UPI0036F6ABA4